MIITRTPLRLSLLGGSTDFPIWFREHGGLVIGGAINRYVYITARALPHYHDFKTRVVYSQTELVKNNKEVEHKVVRAALEMLQLADDYSPGLEITTIADMPSRSGTGSSSSFAVGLLHALAALKGKFLSAESLATAAIHLEQEKLGECVGCQDQTFAAHGGFQAIRFHKDGTRGVYPITIPTEQLRDLESRLMLVFTGISRTSSEIANTYVPTLADKIKEQLAMVKLAEDGLEAVHKGDWEKLGRLLDNSWQIKRSLGSGITNSEIDRLYATARVYGALGGKITGAGGGGCMLLLLKDPSCRIELEQVLKDCVHIDFKFEHDGSRVIFSDRNYLDG